MLLQEMRGEITMVDDSVKRIFALSKQDIYFIVIIIMLGINMGFNFSLVEPVRDVQDAIHEEQTKDIGPQLEELLRSHNISLQVERD